MFINKFKYIGLLPLLAFSNLSYADDFGCKAVLCFAGGKGLSECASTILEVKKRLAKGKGFPHCSFVKADGSYGDNVVSQSNVWTRNLGRDNNVCPDGTITDWYKKKNFKCNAITVTFKGANQDGSDLTQEINW
ncbi:hypothetical protein [Acinetobacter pittii]|uniref:Uncharacterized protein n=1 Tax=Acinetobacter pittii TaxID=48296 RepID=A0A6H0G040_ACIPI|nr:hypothetical protein [Acinetobacter pittii]QIT19991.1 hypothetical protein G8E09_19615 [Acinetobacter pittii]